MKVLYLSYYFPPEIGTGPHLPYELCESLVKLGHDVTAVTGFPRYHMHAMPPQYRGHFLYAEEINGVKVYRVNAPNAYTKLRYLRGFVQQIAPWVLAVRAICLRNKPDIVYTQTPPLAMGLAARFVAKLYGVPCVVNVQDLFPQCVIDLGMLRNRTLIRIFEWMERGIYKKSNLITVMSEGNRNFVIERGGSPDRTIVAPNWVDVDLIRPGERMNDFRRIHGLGNKFVALFAGTMGWSQGIGTLVEAARCLVHQTDVVFLIVGDGVEKERLMKQAEGLPNVRFLPMQTKAVYPQVLAASNVSLVTLRPEVATPTFPSKICTIMAAGRPVIASIPPIEDAPRMITETDCGLVVPAGDAKALADAVLSLKNDEERTRQMGVNGRMHVEKYLSRTVCVRQNEELFRQLTEKKESRKIKGVSASLSSVMDKRLVVITNGNYFASLLLKGLFRDPSLQVVGVLIVMGGYKGYSLLGTVWDLFRRTTFPYFMHKLWTLLVLAVVQRLFPWTTLTVQGFAVKRGIPFLPVRAVNSEDAITWVAAQNPDLLVSMSCPQRIRGKMLATAKLGGVNIHSALLPRYAGLAPYFWVLAGGERVTGVTVHWITQAFDAGNILRQESVPINERESTFSLFKRLAQTGAEVLRHGVLKACEGDKGEKQNLSEYTYFSLPTFRAYMQLRKNGHRLIRPGELMTTVWSEIRRGNETRNDLE